MTALPLSCYVLTLDAERHLGQVLEAIRPACDELIVVDSGSTDRTLEIARAHGAAVYHRPFDDFRRQRNFAQDLCRHLWVLALDADELPTPEFVQGLRALKAAGFRQGEGVAPDAFRMERAWFVLGRPVHAFLPVTSPDHPIRLWRRDRVRYAEDGAGVHETPAGFQRLGRIPGRVDHHTCESPAELERKLELYTDLAARDLLRRGRRSTRWRRALAAAAAWFKWFVLKGGFRDGAVGRVLARYALRYARLKYAKLEALQALERAPGRTSRREAA